jgi:hypothetical protein
MAIGCCCAAVRPHRQAQRARGPSPMGPLLWASRPRAGRLPDRAVAARLFDYDLPAIVKAAIAFVLTVAFSWALTAVLRQIPGATKVL